MLGQGRPISSCRSRLRVSPRMMPRWIGFALVLCAFGISNRILLAEGPLRLRVEWGGGAEGAWRGTLGLSAGTLSQPTALGIDADEPGSIWTDERGIVIRSRSPRVYDGVDVTVTAPADARLIVELGTSRENNQRMEISLAQILADSQSSPLDDRGNRLMVRRAPGDALGINFEQDALVFSPGDVINLEIEPRQLAAPPGTKLLLETRLSAAGNTRPIWTDGRDITTPDAGGSISAIPLVVQLPKQEGIFELVVTVTKRGLQERLGLSTVTNERRVQLVVVSSEPSAPVVAANSGALELLADIDPAKPAWWERLPNLPANIPWMPGLRRGTLGSGDAAPWEHSLGTLMQLGPGAREPSISWEAYPLPVGRPGQPHVVEIEYPSDAPQSLGLSIIEPNAAGVMAPLGIDSGVYLPPEAAENPPALAKHRLAFWPRTTSPLLLVTNRRQGTRAIYGHIRLLGPKASVLTTTLPASVRDLPGIPQESLANARLPRAQAIRGASRGRLSAVYYDRPLFPENFSASQGLDSWTGQSGRTLDDWNTFYEGSTRLVEYLHYSGHRGAIVSVFAEGSTIYPSRLLEPTPRFDDGVFFVTGQDPFRKDALELMLRLFDRDGLKLIPAMQFAAPLPALETLRRRGGAEVAGIELIGVDGKSWVATHGTTRGLAPYYNPLNPRVQEAMLEAVCELADRYREHPSLAGVAVQLSARGYAQLPGAEWALDDDTLERFASEAHIELPSNDPAHRAERVAAVLGKHREAWLSWRADTLHHFYQRMHRELTTRRSEARLYLAAADALHNTEMMRELRPALPKVHSVDQALKSVGIDADRYRDPGLVLLRPYRLAPLDALADQAVNLELNQSAELDQAFQRIAEPGSLFFHEPQEARLPGFDAQSPFRNTHTRLMTEASPSQELNRRRFAHALAALDAQSMFDGGWLLPLGQEDSLHDLLAAYQALPAVRFKTLEGPTQPVTVRTHVADGRTYVYLVNDSPWPVTFQAEVPPAGRDCNFEEYRRERRFALAHGAEGTRTWTVQLAPYDLVAGVFSAANVTFERPHVRLPGDVNERLDARIKDLWARAEVLKHPVVIPSLVNADFEASLRQNRTLLGWEVNTAPQSEARLDAEQPRRGGQALRLSAGPPGVELTSWPVNAPRTGRVSVSVWLRVADDAQQPPLRIAVEGVAAGQPFVRFAPLGQGANAQKLRTEWAQYIFQVQDLPARDLARLRVRFDLTGAGEVWLDDVALYDLDFSDAERIELSKTITLAEYKRSSGAVGDCARLLEGYWPRFLLANVTLTQQQPLAERPPRPASPKGAQAIQALPPTVTPNKPEPRPGMMERVRHLLPEFLR